MKKRMLILWTGLLTVALCACSSGRKTVTVAPEGSAPAETAAVEVPAAAPAETALSREVCVSPERFTVGA